MLHRHLRPGYDYLLERKLTAILREAPGSPLGGDLARFLAGAEALGYSERARTGMASQIAIRVLIQTGRGLAELTDDDFTAFGQAITGRRNAWAASSSITTARSTRPARWPTTSARPPSLSPSGPPWAGGAGNVTWTG